MMSHYGIILHAATQTDDAGQYICIISQIVMHPAPNTFSPSRTYSDITFANREIIEWAPSNNIRMYYIVQKQRNRTRVAVAVMKITEDNHKFMHLYIVFVL